MKYISDQTEFLPPMSSLKAFFDVTDRVKESTQNVFAQICYFCAKRAKKIVAPPKQMLLSFSIVRFLTNYDVTNRKQLDRPNILHCTKMNFLRADQVNGDYLSPCKQSE